MNPSPPALHPPASRRLIDNARIRETVERLGREVSAVYGHQELTVVAVLHGALVFTADLIRQLDMPLRLETVTASSYRGASTAPDRLRVRLEDLDHLRRRHVLLVDDILDTGRTLERVRDDILRFEPASLRTAVLLDKPSRRVVPIQADFVGLEIPDLFVVGYGLDFDGRYRNLPHILALDPDGMGDRIDSGDPVLPERPTDPTTDPVDP